MKIQSNLIPLNFKGYDALPLKALHTSTFPYAYQSEMQEIAQKEGFEIKQYKLNETFCQDFVTVLENRGFPLALAKRDLKAYTPYMTDMSNVYGLMVKLASPQNHSIIAGGNFFIGKKPNGEKWMMIGSADEGHSDKKEISSVYGVKEENIHFIPQQDYHLDMSVRPIGYPYVLVNDPKKSMKIKSKLISSRPVPKSDYDVWVQKQYEKEIEALKKAGFRPIPIGGVHNFGINFLNAIVNKHKDGTISYITNSSKSLRSIDTKYQNQFEKDLRKNLQDLSRIDKKAPKLRNIYFVHGTLNEDGNELTENILGGAGGLHCMHFEEPDFDAWV